MFRLSIFKGQGATNSQPLMLHYLRITVMLGALAVLVSGCAVSPENRAQSAPSALRLEQKQGLMSLKITSNRPTVSTFFTKWTTLRVTNIESKVTTTVVDRSDSSAGHSLFIQPLPSGTYEVESVGNGASGWLTITETAKAGQALPRFRVTEGQLTDLGTLVYVRKHFPVNSTLFRWAQHDSPFDRGAVLRQLDPILSARLSSSAVNSWIDGEQLAARRTVFSESQHLTMRAMSPTQSADGTLYLGESFGRIAARSASGAWSWIETPTALPIRAVHVTTTGSIYAGSDDGIFIIRDPMTRKWGAIPLPTVDASVIHIGPLPGTARLLIVLQTRDRFLGVSMDPKATEGWKVEFSRPRALFLNPAMDANGAVLAAADRVVLVTGGVESKFEVASAKQGEDGWKFTQLNESGIPSSWAISPEGSLGRFRGVPFTGMYFSASEDSGITWEKRGDLNWAGGSLLLVSNKVGYVVRTDSTPLIDPEKFAFSLWRTTDLGKSWIKVGSTPSIHGRLIALDGSPDLIGYASANGKFFVSNDGGKNWQLERQLE
jgi:hypothetical protein